MNLSSFERSVGVNASELIDIVGFEKVGGGKSERSWASIVKDSNFIHKQVSQRHHVTTPERLGT